MLPSAGSGGSLRRPKATSRRPRAEERSPTMRLLSSSLSLASVLLSFLASGCGGGAAPPAAPSAGNETKTPTPSAERPAAEPPASELAQLPFGAGKVKIEECSIDPPLKDEKKDPITSIARVGQRLYVADGSKDVRVYSLKPGCKLQLDATAGDKGIVRAESEIQSLSTDGKIASFSNGVFDSYREVGGKLTACGNHYLALHPSGTWGLTSFVNATVDKVTIAGDKCTTQPWVLKDLSDAKKRVGPLESVSSIAFVNDLAMVGGIATEEQRRVVIAFDAAGKERFRMGGPKSIAEDGFGWVHAISACGPGVCVSDANFRSVSAWSADGKFIGRVKLDEVLKESVPWAQALAEDNGRLLVGVSDRANAGGVTGRVLRLVFP